MAVLATYSVNHIATIRLGEPEYRGKMGGLKGASMVGLDTDKNSPYDNQPTTPNKILTVIALCLLYTVPG